MILKLLIWICVFAFVLFIGLKVSMDKMGESATAIQCCNGSYCTDTYYTAEDNLCHHALCENTPFMKNCTYEGANVSIDLMS